MNVVAVYNMKGGVGKTTAAANLSYLAAASGQRALLWDLDPQAASSFAFRVRPCVAGFGKKSLTGGHALADAIRETDYENLDLLPADFAYRKLDRLLSDVGKPERVMTSLLDTLGRDYDLVFLDCPAGFSLLTEGIFAAVDLVLVPTIPTVLSLRSVARLIKWADRSDAPSQLAAFFSMVDRRKALHRRACEWSAAHGELFLSGQIPYASIVEQMTVRRMPLAVFAAREPATAAFAAIWLELEAWLQRREEKNEANQRRRHDRGRLLRSIEGLIDGLEAQEKQERQPSSPVPAMGGNESAAHFVHTFDTERRELQRRGCAIELHERQGLLTVVAMRTDSQNSPISATKSVEARIDKRWATEILSGVLSPLAALERRLGSPLPPIVESLRDAVGGDPLLRIDSRGAKEACSEAKQQCGSDTASVLPWVARA